MKINEKSSEPFIRKRNIIISILFLSILFSTLSFITALTGDVTLNSPGANALINCTNTTLNFNVNDTRSQLYNLTFYISSTLTANSTWTKLGANDSLNLSGLTANSSTIAFDFVHSLVEDSNNYILNITVFNASGTQFIKDDTNTGLTVDCTVPSAPVSLTPTSDTDNSVTFSSTVVGVNTTSCTLFFVGQNPGNPNYTMTHSGNTCSRALTSVSALIYTWYVRGSDESNTSDSSNQQTNVQISTAAGSSMTPEQVAQAEEARAQQAAYAATGTTKSDDKDKGWFTFTNIIIVLVVGGLGYIIYKRMQALASSF